MNKSFRKRVAIYFTVLSLSLLVIFFAVTIVTLYVSLANDNIQLFPLQPLYPSDSDGVIEAVPILPARTINYQIIQRALIAGGISLVLLILLGFFITIITFPKIFKPFLKEIECVTADGETTYAELASISEKHKTLVAAERQAQREKSRYTEFILHEMRNFLMLVNMKLTKRRYAEIEENIADFKVTLDDIMLYSSIDSHMDLEEADMAELAAAAIDTLSLKCDRIAFHFDDDACYTVPGRQSLLSRAVYNLIDNAVKYAKIGTEIDVTLTKQEKSVQMRIANTSDGIVDKSEWFTPYYTSGVHGKGLGLPFADQIIRKFNGTIALNEEDGKVIFLVTLPAQDEQEDCL